MTTTSCALAAATPLQVVPQPTHEPAVYVLDELTIPRLVHPLGRNCIRSRRHRRYNRGVRERVYEAAAHRCVRCGKPEGRKVLGGHDDDGPFYVFAEGPSLTLHHLHAFDHGGCNHAHNLVALCAPCNTLIGAPR